MAASPPGVSVLLPTLNERTFIRDCLDSLLAEDYPNLVEILVLDGGSTDGTVDVATAEGGVGACDPNPGISVAAAMNVGIATAEGEIVVRADAHTLYAPDYVSRCVDALEAGPAVVGAPCAVGRDDQLRPSGRSRHAHPAGVGPGRFHYARSAADVETVYLGACRRRHTVEDVGGFDEERLQWGAEDQELNYRVRRAGGRIRLDPSIRSWYFPRLDAPGAVAPVLQLRPLQGVDAEEAPHPAVLAPAGAGVDGGCRDRRDRLVGLAAPTPLTMVPGAYVVGLVLVASRVARPRRGAHSRWRRSGSVTGRTVSASGRASGGS